MRKNPYIWRFGALSLAALLVVGFSDRARAIEDSDAERFIEEVTRELLTVRDEKKGAAREDAIRDLLVKNVAFNRLSSFLLGPYARRMDRETRKIYKQLLPEFISKVYVRRLLSYEGEVTMKITKSVKKGSRGREAIVSSEARIETFEEPVQIQWWLLRDREGRFQLFDINVGGFWAAQWQRAEFVSRLRNSKGDFGALFEGMRKQIASPFQPIGPGAARSGSP